VWWLSHPEWAAIWPFLEQLTMSECQRCRSFQADYESMQSQRELDVGVLRQLQQQIVELERCLAIDSETKVIMQQEIDRWRTNANATGTA
jgi:hypothetical protein